MEYAYFQKTYPGYLAQTVSEILSNSSYFQIDQLNHLCNNIFALFHRHVRQPQFFKVTSQILKNTLNQLNANQPDQNLHHLKQYLFVQLYLQKLWFRFGGQTGQDYNPETLHEILWKIRWEFQFSNDEIQDYIRHLLDSLEVGSCNENFKTKIRTLLESNEFETEKYSALSCQQKKKHSIWLQPIPKAKEKENKIVVDDREKLIEMLKKRRQQKKVSLGRTLYFSHPMKYIIKSEKNPIKYGEPESLC